MVQKPPTPRRGRPRAYDPERALDRAMRTFWRGGLAGTSLDDLVASTEMNRPSLYAAFGDKEAIYRKALERNIALGRAVLEEELAIERPLAESLAAIYQRALDAYGAGTDARGCFLSSTASAAATQCPSVRAIWAAAHRGSDALFTARFVRARDDGELPPTADPEALGPLAMGTLHTLALRTRAGETRERLDEIARAAVALLCTGARRPRKRH